MPSSKPAFFFSATQSVDDRLGDVFSFIWASYAGLRELWWQVRGFHHEFPELPVSEMEKKFLSGLPMPGGIDIKNMCLNTSWAQHEQEFAKWLLFEACTLYEGWVEKVCYDVFSAQTYEQHSKGLQFPQGINKKGKPVGFQVVVAQANTKTSPLMITEFLPTLKASKLNCWPTVNEHLTAYRYFKECRNSFIHSEGRTTQDIIDWLEKVKNHQEATPNLFRHQFSLPKQIMGQRIQLNLRDCILFATLVRKLICTFDAALCVTVTSEKLLEQRLRTLVSTNPKWTNLPGDPTKRAQRVHRILSASRIPEPSNLSNVMTWMHSKHII